ncbi:unnamed protein product [Paramecium pentaurelia]|uniref:Uncharacterized protein n=1 Tax=Paramecium pentaurelia TaxID=43138 RepID=A0A8S1Y935_9CILI|nr:unnamed protein product [Paramecium pentaurelia]
MEENSIRFQKYFQVISIDKDDSFIFVASDSSITLFQFKFTQFKLQKSQQLCHHFKQLLKQFLIHCRFNGFQNCIMVFESHGK